MKRWIVHYMMEYYDHTGKLHDFRCFARVEAPDKFAARQQVTNTRSNGTIKLTNGSKSKVLKFTITHVREANNGR